MNSVSNRPPLRLGLVQYRPRKADVSGNLDRVRETIAGVGLDHDILVFPESALSGYFLEGGVAEAARSLADVAEGLGTFPSSGRGPDVVVGFYERWRRRLYNSVGYFEATEDGYQPVHVHRKLFLPTYGVFDEARFVEPGRAIEAFDSRFGRMGMLICEDMWHSLPATVLALAGAELLLVVSASPARDFHPEAGGRPGNLARWDRMARGAAEEHGVFVAVSQLVGSEGGKIFPGGSIALAPDGSTISRGPLMEEAVVTALLEGSRIDRARIETPLLADLEQMLPHLRKSLDRAVSDDHADTEPSWPDAGEDASKGTIRPVLGAADSLTGQVEEGDVRHMVVPTDDPAHLEIDTALVASTLVRFIREEVVDRRGFEKVVIGVSGGVDSAVALFLACEALGPENVYGFRLPYATSSPDSLAHAELALNATGASGRTIEITAPIDAYVAEYEPEISPQRKGNLMARLRGLILFDQSARLHALPLGTGNKSERLLGYFTWHADDSPPINPLGDLFKTQVWALARHLGVPDEIVEKPASADLIRGVHDADELGIGYHRADPILNWLVRGYQPHDLVGYGFDPAEVELVWKRLSSTHWKRELPTVAILSTSAIGEFYLRPVDY